MKKILVEIQVAALNEDGSPRTIKNDEDQEVQEYKTINGYLHHWGTQFETWEDGNGGQHVGQSTIAIVEEVETGIIHTFFPTQLKVLNTVTY